MRRALGRHAVAASAALVALSAAPRAARADESDGIYGRFDGDLELRLGRLPAAGADHQRSEEQRSSFVHDERTLIGAF